jgi:hypothetical protein
MSKGDDSFLITPQEENKIVARGTFQKKEERKKHASTI